jgi:hypothetical protein
MSNSKEIIWKTVKDYENIYLVSNTGIIKSVDHLVVHKNGRNRIQKGRILKTSISKKGYVQVSLSKDNIRFHTGVHRVVAIAFIPNPNNLPEVNHKDGNKLNNEDDNLEWNTGSDNMIHAVLNHLINPNLGEKHHMSKISNKQIINLRNLHKSGLNNKELAKHYYISETAMSNILRKKTYKNI